ncbi:MAG: histidine phosphatase family protein [Chloroflexi bacterium]|nr:histidine phosphatase family protein [Chloroflexota bacterium]
MATDFILVRHGETVWNHDSRYQGHTDVPLGDRGRVQARAVGQRLAKTALDAAYCSDLQRCVETARIILDGRGLAAAPRADLREASHGLWEGLTRQEVAAKYADDLDRYTNDPAHFGGTAGESLGSVQERVWRAVLELADKHPDGRVLIVTHNGPIRTTVCKVLGLDLALSWRLGLINAAITRVRIALDGRSSLLVMNDSCHLKDIQATGSLS